MFLPGMVPGDEVGETLSPPDEEDQARCHESSCPVAASQPVCPNCGGTEFDEDGDCTSCWEPGVVEAAGRPSQRR
jgi:hypothetical protein